MRTLEDTPILPPAVLNSVAADTFREDELIQICLADLRTEDLFRIWDVLDLDIYQLSVPYLARVVSIESLQRQPVAGGPVQDRTLDARLHDADSNAALTAGAVR